MISLANLRRSLIGLQGKQRRSKIEEFASQLDDNAREMYREFFDKANSALKLQGTVTHAYNRLVSRNVDFYEISDFGIHYQIACAVLGKEVRTPAEALKELKRPRRKLGKNRIVPILERYRDRTSEASILELGED